MTKNLIKLEMSHTQMCNDWLNHSQVPTPMRDGLVYRLIGTATKDYQISSRSDFRALIILELSATGGRKGDFVVAFLLSFDAHLSPKTFCSSSTTCFLERISFEATKVLTAATDLING